MRAPSILAAVCALGGALGLSAPGSALAGPTSSAGSLGSAGAGVAGSPKVTRHAAAPARGSPSDSEAQAEKRASAFKAAYARPKGLPPAPRENPTTREKVELGRTLFFDPRLSTSKWISCATCHNPGLAWGDGLPLGLGHGMKALGRRTPTILNVAWVEPLMWDGRFATLEEQALGPIFSRDEMAMQAPAELLARVGESKGYRALFEAAFPGEPIAEATIAKALASYQRTIVSGKAPFDAWVEGKAGAISVEAKRGFVLFNGKAACASCHSGWRFTDDSFHDIGVADADKGRGALPDFADIPALEHAFKTPTLRNVDRRAPYLHDGSEPTLEAVIEFYDVGGRAKRQSLSNEIRPLGLSTDEKADLLAFLRTLTSVDAPQTVPELPR